MRKVLIVVLLAGLLVLALSMPALAEPSDPPCAYGQFWKYLNHYDPVGIAHPGEAPPGQDVSFIIHNHLPPGFTWGDVVEMSKQAATAWWAATH